MDTLVIDRSKKWTVEDYLQMEEEVKCEILNGELIMKPAPLISHQRTVGLLYQKFGVQEYWIVDPANKTLEIFELNASSQYKLLLSLAIRGKVLSNVLKEFSSELAEIF